MSVKIVETGHPDGRPVVYFHGAPGGVQETQWLDTAAKKHRLKILCVDRFSIDPTADDTAYFQLIAQSIRERLGSSQAHFVGFSIGCHVAVQVCVLLKEAVLSMHLVSAAGPLQSGAYLADMAGGTVFKLAMQHPRGFRLLTFWQSLIVRLSPRLLYRLIFSGAHGRDVALARRADFKHTVSALLKQTYGVQVRGYARDINAYVSPWQQVVRECQACAVIWHGAEDNWSPPAMAEYLSRELPRCRALHRLQECSHYSCLLQAIEPLCRQIADS